MGSSLSHAHWTAIAIVCGLLYLIFDAARSFVQQVGPVTLRRWSGDPEMEAARRWFQYDPRNLQLLSGAMLQISLVVAMAATVMAFDDHPTWEACLYAVVLWIVVAAAARRSFDELARMFSESKYSRIPIYTESIDRITGIVHVKDLFDVVLRHEEKSVSELARPPYFVPETKKVSELLRELQSEHLQVAVVVDEYGGTAGIITLEDSVEA